MKTTNFHLSITFFIFIMLFTTSNNVQAAQSSFDCIYSHCPQIFSTQDHLKEHLKTHPREKKYPCPHSGCRGRFSNRGNLTVHLRIHNKKDTKPLIDSNNLSTLSNLSPEDFSDVFYLVAIINSLVTLKLSGQTSIDEYITQYIHLLKNSYTVKNNRERLTKFLHIIQQIHNHPVYSKETEEDQPLINFYKIIRQLISHIDKNIFKKTIEKLKP